MKAFLNCPTCSTDGWVKVNEEQHAVCPMCGFYCELNNHNVAAIITEDTP